MNIYSIFRYFNRFNAPRLKLFGIFLLHIFRRRYLGVFFDPVLACNLRCKMCHFSNSEQRKEMKGLMDERQVKRVADSFFKRALKLQIGCGAEPTLYKDIPSIIRLAKEKGIPFVSMVTNANLLNENSIEKCLNEGLDEIILSLHGVKKESYEFFMPNANFEAFCKNLKIISDKREIYDFNLRINYTINEDNVDELADFFKVFDNLNIDVIQMRPISKYGETEYNNFSHDKIFKNYDTSIQLVKDEAIKRNIICIAPTKNQMQITEGRNDNGVIYDATYCYISPNSAWKEDYNIEKETFKEYCKRRHWSWVLFQYMFISLDGMNRLKKSLNYNID